MSESNPIKPSPKTKHARNKESFRSKITLLKKTNKLKKETAEPGPPSIVSSLETKVFGISLLDAIDRSVIQDDILIPTVFRECIDYIETYGLETEGLYRVGGPVKSIEAVKQQYDRGNIIHVYRKYSLIPTTYQRWDKPLELENLVKSQFHSNWTGIWLKY